MLSPSACYACIWRLHWPALLWFALCGRSRRRRFLSVAAQHLRSGLPRTSSLDHFPCILTHLSQNLTLLPATSTGRCFLIFHFRLHFPFVCILHPAACKTCRRGRSTYLCTTPTWQARNPECTRNARASRVPAVSETSVKSCSSCRCFEWERAIQCNCSLRVGVTRLLPGTS